MKIIKIPEKCEECGFGFFFTGSLIVVMRCFLYEKDETYHPSWNFRKPEWCKAETVSIKERKE